MEALRHKDNPKFGGLILRRTTVQVRNTGGLWARSNDIYPAFGAKGIESYLLWRFPSGATLRFNHMELESSRYIYQGAELPFIAFDELTHFESSQFFYMLSRNRSMCGVRPYIRATCLSGDTYLHGDGCLIRLDSCNENLPLQSVFVESGDLFQECPTHIYKRQAEYGVRIVTTQGETICTPDHELYAWSEGEAPLATRAEKLMPGCYLAAVKQVPHGKSSIDPDSSYLVGYTLGDGGITGRRHLPRLYWTEQNRAHAKYVAEIAESVLQTTVGMHKRNSDSWAVYTTSGKAAVAAQFIRDNADAIKPANQRSIPFAATCGNEKSVRALLQGIFDAEGHVSYQTIAMAVVSRAIAQQVGMLLRRWGIVARFSVTVSKPPRKRVYRLTLGGRQAIAFARLIGFRMRKKQKATEVLTVSLERTSKWKRNRETDLIPIDRKAISHLRHLFRNSWWNKNTNIRRDTANHVIELAKGAGLDYRTLEKWAGYSWERIKSLDRVDLHEFYDVTMPSTHIYLAGSLLSHNCNPDPDSFVAQLIAWWIDWETGLAIPERSGVLRWFIRLPDDHLDWADSAAELKTRHGPDCGPKSLTFIRAQLQDNAILVATDPTYESSLKALPRVERERLLGGNWKVRPCAGMVFRREWFRVEDARPAEARRVRCWDFAATEPSAASPDPDWTVGLLLARDRHGVYWIEDVLRLRVTAGRVKDAVLNTASQDGTDVEISVPQDPSQAGKAQAEDYLRDLAGYMIRISPTTKNKITRAGPASSQAEHGNIRLVKGRWNEDFLTEADNFGEDAIHDDQVDCLSDGVQILSIISSTEMPRAIKHAPREGSLMRSNRSLWG